MTFGSVSTIQKLIPSLQTLNGEPPRPAVVPKTGKKSAARNTDTAGGHRRGTSGSITLVTMTFCPSNAREPGTHIEFPESVLRTVPSVARTIDTFRENRLTTQMF